MVPVECSCETCKAMCQRPCWPSPDEAQKLIDVGYGPRLMNDYWVGGGPDGDNIELLCPALKGYEGKSTPYSPRGKCTFQDEAGLCKLHDLGLKPIEGRLASCKHEDGEGHRIHEDTAMTWNNPEAQQKVKDWRATFL